MCQLLCLILAEVVGRMRPAAPTVPPPLPWRLLARLRALRCRRQEDSDDEWEVVEEEVREMPLSKINFG